MTRVLVWPSDRGGCGCYRLIWPAEALIAEGADVRVDFTGPTCVWDRRWSGVRPPADVRLLSVQRPDADVVIIQRPSLGLWTQIAQHLQAQGIRVVVDVDDDYSNIQPDSEARKVLDPKRNPSNNWAHVEHACRIADFVTVTTPGLAKRYGKPGRVAVLPNRVPERYLSIEAERFPVRIGWSGNVAHHPQDLEEAGSTVQQVMDAVPGTSFHAVGTGWGVKDALRLDEEPTTSGGWLPIEQYPAALAGLDVGIVPLSSHPFNTRGKSWLKGLEMASVGVPVIASPTEDYLRLAALGACRIAKKPAQWIKELTRLATSAELRAEMGGKAREIVAGSLTIEGNTDLWATAWGLR